jgi:hypothetical protein
MKLIHIVQKKEIKLYCIAKIVSMFSPLQLAPDVGVGIGLLLVPTAIQEMVFAVWMIVKGFNPSAIAALSAKKGLNEV